MQIDFHFSVTYTVARMAGFEHLPAYKIAYSAQYVDDATNQGAVKFENGAMYNRISSAHKMLDYRNFAELANHFAWIPFHFLPGNGGLPAGENPKGKFIEKIVCKPNSFIAKDMLKTCLSHKEKPYALHLLGITAHVYVDTWAHQGFAGVTDKINSIYDIEDDAPDSNKISDRLSDFFKDIFDSAASRFVADAQPLGHGAALSNPDMPFLKWSYKDGNDNEVIRDNFKDFTTATTQLYRYFREYLGSDENSQEISSANLKMITDRFKSFTDENGENRNDQWIKDLTSGKLGFEVPELDYVPKGKNSWKHDALGTEKKFDLKEDEFPYNKGFIDCDWKLFHDALILHRYYVIHDILPRYGICVA